MKQKTACMVMLVSILSASLAADLVFASEFTAESVTPESIEVQEKNGLLKEGGSYYYYEDGTRLKDSWMTVGGSRYYFQKNGKAATGSVKVNGKYYIFDSHGKLQQPSSKKIIEIEKSGGKSAKYYVNTDGTAVSGWSKNRKYYFYETGEMVTGIEVFNEKFYYFNAGGRYSAAKTTRLRKAAKYEKPFDSLKKLIGKPVKEKYYASCYGKGKDGILTYENFIVYTFKPDEGREIFMGAE